MPIASLMLNYTNTLLLSLKLMFLMNTTSLVWAHAKFKEIKVLCKLKMKNFGAVVLQLARKKMFSSQSSQDMEEMLTLKLSLLSQYPIQLMFQTSQLHLKKFQFKRKSQSALIRLSSEWMISISFPLLEIKLRLLKLMVLNTYQLNQLQVT